MKLRMSHYVTVPFSSASRGIDHNPVGVGEDLIPISQGSSGVATLGYMPESRWDTLASRNWPATASAIKWASRSKLLKSVTLL